MSDRTFRQIFEDFAKPKLKTYDFTGNGYTYRKITKNVVYLVEIGRHKSENKVCFDFGLHFPKYKEDFDYVGEPIISEKIKLHQCDFWKRLNPDNLFDHWWTIPSTNKEQQVIIQSIWTVFKNQGIALVNTFSNYPEPFISLTIDELEINNLQKLHSPNSGTALFAALISASELIEKKI
jgi:hypothetical protein